MCRFVAYLGEEPMVLSQLLSQPANSLIDQSKHAKETASGLNADGFGIGWYNHRIDAVPGLFKSIQPAWNDQNLKHVASKIYATCFMGHVRASTIGDVTLSNCHPFSYHDFLFVHNGTIREFNKVKRQLQDSLSEEVFESIKGQTDSEHFFALLMDKLHAQAVHEDPLHSLVEAMLSALKDIKLMQEQLPHQPFTRLNTALTDGKRMLVTRYVSDMSERSLSLYYSLINHSLDDLLDNRDNSNDKKAIVIASEPLTDIYEEWQEIPVNHMLLVDQQLQVKLEPIVLAEN